MRLMMRAALAVAVLMPLLAQLPEAETPEEFDDYLSVEAGKDPGEVAARAASFAKRWPESKLLARVYELRFFALQKLGRAAEAGAAAEESLRLAPENATVTAAYAVQLASEDPERAKRLAADALGIVERLRVPRSVPLEQYRRMTGRARSQAHIALGLVSFRAGDTSGALRELEAAEQETPEPDATLALRLGRLYAALGRKKEARARLEAATRADDPAVAKLAREALKGLVK